MRAKTYSQMYIKRICGTCLKCTAYNTILPAFRCTFSAFTLMNEFTKLAYINCAFLPGSFGLYCKEFKSSQTGNPLLGDKGNSKAVRQAATGDHKRAVTCRLDGD